MSRHIANARSRLADLGALSAQADADEKRILGNAVKQREALALRIERQRVGIEAADDAAQKRYTDDVAELGRLEVVISKSKRALQM